MERHIQAPVNEEEWNTLRAGDSVYITGTIYTARDAAHKRMQEALEKGMPLPVELKVDHSILYGAISSQRRKSHRLGGMRLRQAVWTNIHPSASGFRGLKGMIGKGKRSKEVREAIVRNGAVYFAAIGGAGALLSKSDTEIRSGV